jgi:hypothetical protein
MKLYNRIILETIYLWLYSPFVGLWPLFHFLDLFT